MTLPKFVKDSLVPLVPQAPTVQEYLQVELQRAKLSFARVEATLASLHGELQERGSVKPGEIQTLTTETATLAHILSRIGVLDTLSRPPPPPFIRSERLPK